MQAAEVRAAIVARIGSADRPEWVTTSRWERARETYERFGNAPLWLEEGGVQARATALLAAIRAAPEHGLDTAAYPMGAIERVVDAKRLSENATAATIADADILLTTAYVAYAADMLAGQVNPKTQSDGWFIPASPQDIDSAIVRGIEGDDMAASLASMAPHDPDYEALRTAYARYLRIAASGGWPTVVAPGRDTAAATLLHTRLAAEFEADTGRSEDRGADSLSTVRPHKAAATVTGVADAHMLDMVRQFQRRYGLEPTGRVNAETLVALNVPADYRLAQIAANLERYRWMPRSLGGRYIFVNVPAFRLRSARRRRARSR